MDNIAVWKAYSLRLVAALYSALPSTLDIDASHALKKSPKEINYDEMAGACGAIKWLYENGMINGKVGDESPETFFLFSAQPTSDSFAYWIETIAPLRRNPSGTPS